MMGFMESAGLRMEGFTDAQIAQIDAIRPDIEHLANLIKAEMPRINRVVNVVQMAVHVFNAKQNEITR